MKKLPVRTVQYRRLEISYAHWLGTLGYSESVKYGYPLQLREFFHWLEHKDIIEVDKITQQIVNQYMDYYQSRPNARRSGGISVAHINKMINNLRQFMSYLHHSTQTEVIIHLNQLPEKSLKVYNILTLKEVQALYETIEDDVLGMRDRAMLGVYYGCGLRKKEGHELDVSDVLFDRKLLYVRKTKNRQERYVPLNRKSLKDLECYIYDARPSLVKGGNKEAALFISERGTRLSAPGLSCSLQKLQDRLPSGANTAYGLHTLRHSVATHLLQGGMSLENIALFLGHKTLDSTQIYTHIVNQGKH